MMTFVNSLLGRLRGMAVTMAVALMAVGCQTPQPPPALGVPSPAVGAPGTNAPQTYTDKLSPGNKITITFSETSNPPAPHEEAVREDGKITPPLVGTLHAAGKTAGELQEELHNLYVPKYFKRLTVTVNAEARFFSVDGEVRNPSLQTYIGEMTVLKGIAASGGFTDFAKKSKVHLIRPGKDKPILVNCDRAQKNPSLDIPIYPGDRIWVPRRLWW